jgi:hypothetical protein
VNHGPHILLGFYAVISTAGLTKILVSPAVEITA